MIFKRIFNQGIARLAARSPMLTRKLVAGFTPREMANIPWTNVHKPVKDSSIALVTTAGVHHRHQPAFDMQDASGDPSFRSIDPETIEKDYVITHDYYDHKDADRDLNIVFPIAHLKAMHKAGYIGGVASIHFSFMGHIDGGHIDTLIRHSAPQVAHLLKHEKVDMVLLTPA